MECIGCTACIDACDDVMTRLGRLRGLIRYDSQSRFSGGNTRWLRPRTLLYFVLLAIGASVATWALTTVKPANFGITRMIGSPYVVDATSVRNQFLVRIVNKRHEAATFMVQLTGGKPGITSSGFETAVDVPALEEIVQPLILQQSRATYTGPFKLEVSVRDTSGKFQLVRAIEFLGPDARLLREEEK
jgi:polyferredoxin